MSLSKFTKEELERIFDEVFNHFKRRRVFYNELEEYLEAKGYSKDDVLEAWGEAIKLRIIDSGVFPVKGKPMITITRPAREDVGDEIII